MCTSQRRLSPSRWKTGCGEPHRQIEVWRTDVPAALAPAPQAKPGSGVHAGWDLDLYAPAIDLDRLRAPMIRLFERDLDFGGDIGTADGSSSHAPPLAKRIPEEVTEAAEAAATAARCRALAKAAAQAEDAPQDLVDILVAPQIEVNRAPIGVLEVEATSARLLGLFPLRPEAVIGLPLLRVAEHLVGLAQLLELLGSSGVAGVHVRVVFARELSERLLDLFIRRVPLHAQHLVVVLEC